MIAVARKSAKINYNAPKFRPRADSPDVGYWYVWHDGKQNQLTKFGATRANVKPGSRNYVAQVIPAFHAWAADYEATLQARADHAEAERVASSGKVVVGLICNNYLTKLERDSLTSATYRENAKRFLTAFCTGRDGKGIEVNGIAKYAGYGNLPAERVTKKVLEQWVSYHPRWTQTTTSLSPIRAAYNLAVEDGLIAAVPFGRLKLSGGKARQDYFSRSEEAAFRAAIASSSFAEFFDASIDLGTRPGELAQLRREHVKESPNGYCWRLEWNEWKAGRKTQKSRVIFLPAKWVEWTKRRLADMQPGEYLFRPVRACSWTRASWGGAFRDALAKTDLHKDLVLYSARHTFITRALLASWSAAKVAAYCGTSEKEIRNHYGHLINEGKEMIALAESVAAL